MQHSKQQKEILKVHENIIKYVDKQPDKEFENFINYILNRAAENLDVPIKDVGQVLVMNNAMQFVQNYMFEVFVTGSFNGGNQNLINKYIDTQGWQNSSFGIEFLKKMISSELKLWEICNVSPGHWIEVRELDTKLKPVKVYEKSGSKYLTKWSVVAARIIFINDVNIFTGGVLNFSREMGGEINANYNKSSMKLDKVALKKDLPVIYLAIWISDLYHKALGEVPKTKFINKDGHNFEFIEIQLPFIDSNKEIISSLLSKARFLDSGDKAYTWLWLDKNGGLEKRLLGNLKLTDKFLKVSVNSDVNKQLIIDLLGDILGDKIGVPLSVHEDVNVMLNEFSSDGINDDSIDIKEHLGPSVVDELIVNSMNKHYRETLNMPIPALNNQSPMECSKKNEEHDMLIKWLKSIENNSASNPDLSNYDFKWMWVELGLEYPD